MGISRKQSTPNFRKKEYFILPDTHTNILTPRYVQVRSKLKIKRLGGCHQARNLGRGRDLAYPFLNIKNSALNLGKNTLIVSIYGLNEVLRASRRKNSRIFTCRAILCCVIDKMFIELPLCQETLATLKSF